MTTRGKLLAGIREKIGVSQFDMAAKLNAEAERIGLPASYRDYTVSRNESGTISFEDAAVWLSIDPDAKEHGWHWFVFGPASSARAQMDDATTSGEVNVERGSKHRPRRVAGGRGPRDR